MPDRNYDTNPVEVEFKVKMFFYEHMTLDNLKRAISNTCDNPSIQEEVFNTFLLYDNAGLNEITATIIVPPTE